MIIKKKTKTKKLLAYFENSFKYISTNEDIRLMMLDQLSRVSQLWLLALGQMTESTASRIQKNKEEKWGKVPQWDSFRLSSLSFLYLDLPEEHHRGEPLLSLTKISSLDISLVQFSHSVMSNSLRPHESQHTRPPCPSPTPGVHSNSCPMFFPMSQLFAWGGRSTGVSALASVLPMEHPGLISFRIDPLDLFAAQWTLKSLLQHHSSKASILWCSAFFTVQLSHPYMTTGKTIGSTRWTFVGKVMSLLFNMLSRLVIRFLPRSKCLFLFVFFLLFFS